MVEDEVGLIVPRRRRLQSRRKWDFCVGKPQGSIHAKISLR